MSPGLGWLMSGALLVLIVIAELSILWMVRRASGPSSSSPISAEPPLVGLQTARHTIDGRYAHGELSRGGNDHGLAAAHSSVGTAPKGLLTEECTPRLQ
jgi:hypothetical protein